MLKSIIKVFLIIGGMVFWPLIAFSAFTVLTMDKHDEIVLNLDKYLIHKSFRRLINTIKGS